LFSEWLRAYTLTRARASRAIVDDGWACFGYEILVKYAKDESNQDDDQDKGQQSPYSGHDAAAVRAMHLPVHAAILLGQRSLSNCRWSRA
jgi:hypothetical protein